MPKIFEGTYIKWAETFSSYLEFKSLAFNCQETVKCWNISEKGKILANFIINDWIFSKIIEYKYIWNLFINTWATKYKRETKYSIVYI